MVENPINPLNKLSLDVWYMVLIPIGAIVMLYGLVWVQNKEWFLFGLGFIFVGLGEWKNNKWVYMTQEPTAYQSGWRGNIPRRIPDKVGNLLLLLGFICIGIWAVGFFVDVHIISPDV